MYPTLTYETFMLQNLVLVTTLHGQIKTLCACDERGLGLQVLPEAFVVILHRGLGQVGKLVSARRKTHSVLPLVRHWLAVCACRLLLFAGD